MRQHLALYGNTQIVRAHCYQCKRFALVVDDILQCCDRRIEASPTKVRRMSTPEERRRLPAKAQRERILEAQGYRCLYCDVSLNGYVTYHDKIKKVRLTWDHMAPYTYTLDNHAENFAATCQFCNAWKSSLIFKTVDEVRIYVATKWEAERESESELRGMRNEV